MTDTRKEFEEAMKVLPEFRLGDFYVFSGMSLQWKSWQACQSLNDKRIQQLLAVIAKKDEALQSVIDYDETTAKSEADDIQNYFEYIENAKLALAIKPENVELVEVGYTSEASMTNLITGNDVIVGKKTELRTETIYTIKTKGQQ